MKKRVYLIVLAVLVLLLLAILFLSNSDKNTIIANESVNNLTNNSSNIDSSSCSQESDCVPAPFCHPTYCINKNEVKPNNMLCTQECKPNTLDCGQGSCSCVNNKCRAVFK